MTNDELLSGFLDRSLSEDQLLEFEARKQSDPSFTSEVDDMLAVEQLLVTSAPKGLAPGGFLIAVESAIALKVASSTTVGTTVGGLFASTWAWIAAAGLTMIGAATVYLVNDSQQQSIPQVRITTRHAASPSTDHLPQPVTTQPQQSAKGKAPSSSPAIKSVAPANRVASGEGEGSVAPNSINLSVDNNESTLASLKKDLEACRAIGDHIRCTQIALQIGRTYRERKLEDQAMNYLNMALQEARAAHIIQYEVDAFGEIGLMLREVGRISEANENFTAAIELGTRHGIDVSRWDRSIR